MLDKLEAKNLVTRNNVPGNRRIHHVRLTSEGTALVDNVERPYRNVVNEAIAGLSDADCDKLIALLEYTRDHVRDSLTENGSPSK